MKLCSLVFSLVLIQRLMAQTTTHCPLEAECMRNSDIAYNDFTIATNDVTLVCRCTLSECMLPVIWSVDRDIANGRDDETINTTDTRYVVPEGRPNDLIITGANGMDSGVYSCRYSNDTTVARRLCAVVLGQAKFVECSNDARDNMESCLEETPISELVGGDINFNTRIEFVGTGGCGNQNVIRLRLTRGDGTQLASCNMDGCDMDDMRISPSSTVDENFNFNLTLMGVRMNDSGMYTLRVDVLEEGSPTESLRTFNKMFSVTISAPPTTPTTSEEPTTSDATMGDTTSPSSTNQPAASGTDAVAIAVPIVLVLFLIVITVPAVLVGVWYCYRRKSEPSTGLPVKYERGMSQVVPLTGDRSS